MLCLMDLRISQIVNDLVKQKDHLYFHVIDKGSMKETFYLAGSLREGSFSTSFFNTNKNNVNEVPSIDIDVGLKGSGLMDKKYRHCIIDIENKTGFVFIKIQNETEKIYWKEFIKSYNTLSQSEIIFNETIGEDGYIKTYKLKDHLRKMKRNFKPRSWRLIVACLLDILLERISVDQTRNVTKSTYEHTNTIYVDGQTKGIIHVDISILMQLDWPCPYIKAWKKRQRLWPDLQLLKKELDTSYVIAKTSREEKNNKEAIEFQYSFPNVEFKIMSLLSSNQRTVFYTAKVVFKQWIKPYSEVYLPSFLIKNIILWMCEQNPPDHSLWDFHSEDDFMRVLRYIFVKLKEHLKDGLLPYYFIPQINLIEGIPAKLSQVVIAKLEDITLNVKTYFADNEKRVTTVGNLMKSMDVVLYRLMDFYEGSERLGSYTYLVTSTKHVINNIAEYVENKDGYDGDHRIWKQFLSRKGR